MKVLFTADLHIKLGQRKIPKKWYINRYNILFNELARVYKEQKCELEIHGGDIFDKLPTLEELCIYTDYIARLNNQPIIIFDGNHEATKKGKTFFSHLKKLLEGLNAQCQVLSEPTIHYSGIDFIPYTHIKQKDLTRSFFNYKILCTHVRGNIPPHVKAEIDLDKLNKWDIVFAGDLHAHSNSQRNIVYPGSPMAVVFHRNKIKTGCIVFDTNSPKDWTWHELKIPQLYRKTVTDKKDMIKTEFDHTIYELEGNALELLSIDKDMELLDKKIVYRSTEAALDLQGLTVREELNKYLSKILKIKGSNLNKILEVYDDNITKIDVG